jgi:hypothetical protein
MYTTPPSSRTDKSRTPVRLGDTDGRDMHSNETENNSDEILQEGQQGRARLLLRTLFTYLPPARAETCP